MLVHGVGSQRQIWDPVLARLAAERDVLTLDLPGHGESPSREAEPTIAALADAVADLAGALGLERPHVAGFSLGGGIALELARTGRARSATALNPIGFGTPRERVYTDLSLNLSGRIARLLRGVAREVTTPVWLRTALFSQLFARPWRIPPAAAAGALRNLASSPGFDRTLPHIKAWHWTAGDLDVPVTIAWGTRDHIHIPRQARRARRMLPRARHLPLTGCGHTPTYDDPDRVAAVLLAGSS